MSKLENKELLATNKRIATRLQSALEKVISLRKKCNIAKSVSLPVRVLGYTAFTALPLHYGNDKAYWIVFNVGLGAYLISGIVNGVVWHLEKEELKEYEEELELLRELMDSDEGRLRNNFGKTSLLLKELPVFEKVLFEDRTPVAKLPKYFCIGMHAIGPLFKHLDFPEYSRELVRALIGGYLIGQIGFQIYAFHSKTSHPAINHGNMVLDKLEQETKQLEELLKG